MSPIPCTCPRRPLDLCLRLLQPPSLDLPIYHTRTHRTLHRRNSLKLRSQKSLLLLRTPPHFPLHLFAALSSCSPRHHFPPSTSPATSSFGSGEPISTVSLLFFLFLLLPAKPPLLLLLLPHRHHLPPLTSPATLPAASPTSGDQLPLVRRTPNSRLPLLLPLIGPPPPFLSPNRAATTSPPLSLTTREP